MTSTYGSAQFLWRNRHESSTYSKYDPRKITPARVIAAHLKAAPGASGDAVPFLGRLQLADVTSFYRSSPSYTGSVSRAEAACAELRQAASDMHLPAPLCEELHAAVERAAERSTESMNDLRHAVAQFTVALKVGGATPEAVLIALKSVINSRTFPIPRDYILQTGGDELRQQISAWSIQEFFRETQA